LFNYADISKDFKKKLFPGYIRIANGNAIIGAQYVEKVLNFHSRHLSVLKISPVILMLLRILAEVHGNRIPA
jgi:hypothetical protein